VLDATRRRIDPQMFHFIIWGAIVLVWYPCDNWLAWRGAEEWQPALGVGSLLLGATLSSIGGAITNRKPRLPSGDSTLSAQIGQVVGIFIGTAVVCTLFAQFAIADMRWMIPFWGLTYALLLMVLGALYSGACFWCGLVCLAGTLASVLRLEWAGFVVGLTMGPAAIVAGILAERRVRQLQHETVHVPEG
jgi:hypothetical protein